MKISKPKNPKVTFDLLIKRLKQNRITNMDNFIAETILDVQFKRERLLLLLPTIDRYDVIREGLCDCCGKYNLVIIPSNLDTRLRIDFERINLVWKISDLLSVQDHEDNEEYYSSLLHDNDSPEEVLDIIFEATCRGEIDAVITDYLSGGLLEMEENEVIARTWFASIEKYEIIETTVCECGLHKSIILDITDCKELVTTHEIHFQRGHIWWYIVDIYSSEEDSDVKSIFRFE